MERSGSIFLPWVHSPPPPSVPSGWIPRAGLFHCTCARRQTALRALNCKSSSHAALRFAPPRTACVLTCGGAWTPHLRERGCVTFSFLSFFPGKPVLKAPAVLICKPCSTKPPKSPCCQCTLSRLSSGSAISHLVHGFPRLAHRGRGKPPYVEKAQLILLSAQPSSLRDSFLERGYLFTPIPEKWP